jgi:hypothetical protein
MLIIGCDYHPSCQQIAFVDTETGELCERRLLHLEEVEGFYSELKEQHSRVRVVMEASGHSPWVEVCYRRQLLWHRSRREGRRDDPSIARDSDRCLRSLVGPFR